MIELLLNNLGLINIRIFLFSALIFFMGYAFAPTAYYKKIRFLTAYPLWIAAKLEVWSKKKWNPYFLFIFLFGFNFISLLVNFLSGLALFLPLIFALWTGINIGLVTYHTLKGEFYYAALINPVALFELPAAFISFSAAIQYNIQLAGISIADIPAVSFGDYFTLFLITVTPLLFISGIIETALIVFARKIEKGGNGKI